MLLIDLLLEFSARRRLCVTSERPKKFMMAAACCLLAGTGTVAIWCVSSSLVLGGCLVLGAAVAGTPVPVFLAVFLKFWAGSWWSWCVARSLGGRRAGR